MYDIVTNDSIISNINIKTALNNDQITIMEKEQTVQCIPLELYVQLEYGTHRKDWIVDREDHPNGSNKSQLVASNFYKHLGYLEWEALCIVHQIDDDDIVVLKPGDIFCMQHNDSYDWCFISNVSMNATYAPAYCVTYQRLVPLQRILKLWASMLNLSSICTFTVLTAALESELFVDPNKILNQLLIKYNDSDYIENQLVLITKWYLQPTLSRDGNRLTVAK